jgi:hypothetical protein
MIEKKPENRFQTFHCILQELQTKGMVPDSALLVRRSGQTQLTARQTLQHALERRRTYIGRVVSIVLALAIILFLGWSSGYGYRTWINPPFVDTTIHDVPRKETVEEQWIYACFVNTPDAWQAVIDYFPDEAYFWEYKVKRQLIRYYYFNNDRHNSRPLFQEFSELSEFYLEEQMLGLAGLMWCAVMDEADIQIAQNYLYQIRLFHYISDDELYFQILDAATRKLRERRADTELPANESL